MVKLFDLSANCKAAAVRGVLATHSSIFSILQGYVPGGSGSFDNRQLGTGGPEVDDIGSDHLSDQVHAGL